MGKASALTLLKSCC